MAKRVILCDLDGTLINRQYELTVPLSTLVSVVQSKQAEGYLIGLNSDTPILPLRGWARELSMRGPLLGEKGQLLSLSPDRPPQIYGKMPEFFRTLRQQVMVRAHEEIPEAFVGVGDVTQFIINEGGVYGVDRCAILINGYRQCSFSGYALGSDQGEFRNDSELFNRFCDLVFSVVGDNQELLDEPDKNVESSILILHEKGASKSPALERLLEHMGDDTEIVMIGDSNADIISIERKIKLCAVRNASPTLKQRALESGGIVSSKAYTEGVVEIISLL